MTSRPFSILSAVALTVVAVTTMTAQNPSRRRMTPVENPSTITQTINEARNDSARILEARKARSTHFNDEEGRTVYVDTVTGEQWIDSTAMRRVVKMKYPLFHSASAGIDIWDPLMRAFGQHYGLIGAWAEVSLYNRYNPVFEFGLGQAKNTPSGNNFTYSSPMSVYFKLGMNYNFLYNSNPDYLFYAGVRYGFSPFSYTIDNITVDNSYWGENTSFAIPTQHTTVGWFEFMLGLRVKLWGPISAGWSFKYRSILHESTSKHGQPWYIPGFGSRSASVSGSFSVSYTFSLDKTSKTKPDDVTTDAETQVNEAGTKADQ